MEPIYHSVTLQKDLCVGCTRCVKRCPTEAIRVREGKARIIKERCIDCGECIRICPHHAKKAVVDPLSIMDRFPYKIALPAPSLFGQFNNLDDVNIVLGALKGMGFDEVYEVAKAAEMVSDYTRQLLAENKLKRPVISSACPVVVRLIRVRFPELIDNILPVLAPIELAARTAKREYAARRGVPESEIGCIFISPCAAKSTACKMPLGTYQSAVDGVVAIRDIYPRLLSLMRQIDHPEQLASAGIMGIGWGSSGGEATALGGDRYLAADGIENIIRVLEELEDEKITDLDFVELNACSGGCVGGVLTVENPYIAKAKLQRLHRFLPQNQGEITLGKPEALHWERKLEYQPVLELDSDLRVALDKMRQIQEVERTLYGMDCGACGAPSCHAMAEDIVLGYATGDMCIYRMREELGQLPVRNEDSRRAEEERL